jgi:hypothetical protein
VPGRVFLRAELCALGVGEGAVSLFAAESFEPRGVGRRRVFTIITTVCTTI